MMERICLIIPPSEFLLDERVFMSIGILRVAAVVERSGLGVEVLDLSGIKNYQEVVKDHVRRTKASVFGITATTPQLPASVEVAKTIRMARSDGRIILGGPHVTLVNVAHKREQRNGEAGRATEAMRMLEAYFDTLVAGDGEVAIFQAIQPNAPQLIDADDPQSELFLTRAQLSTLPFPARHLVDVGSYHYSIDGERAYSMIAQLGCPFECGFCGGRASPSLRRVRMRDHENVVAEMVQMYKTMGNRGFMLYDDELNVNPGMLKLMASIIDTQQQLGVKWKLRGFVKAELFTDQQAEAMYKAGFRWILIGFESGSSRILENINKKATREENVRAIAIARRNGLKVKALMSIGHPGETGETVEETRRWLLEVSPDDFDVSIITCYPGTPYYDHALPLGHQPGIWVYTQPKTGDRLYQVNTDFTQVAEFYKGDPDGGYEAFVFTDRLSRSELVALRGILERDIRRTLNIPFNHKASAVLYEHSMGQGGPLPRNILRMSAGTTP